METERLLKGTFISFTSGQILSPSFSGSLPLMLCSFLLSLLPHFGTTVLVLGPVTIIVNPVPIFSHRATLSRLPLPLLFPTLPTKISQLLSVTKSSAYSPVVIIFQISSGSTGRQSPDQLLSVRLIFSP